MATFVTIGYGDRTGYDRTGIGARAAAHAHDADLLAGGAVIGVAGNPLQVRNHDDEGVQATAGAFLRSDLPVAGFSVIEADNVAEAVRIVSATPCAVAHGVVEVWPLHTTP